MPKMPQVRRQRQTVYVRSHETAPMASATASMVHSAMSVAEAEAEAVVIQAAATRCSVASIEGARASATEAARQEAECVAMVKTTGRIAAVTAAVASEAEAKAEVCRDSATVSAILSAIASAGADTAAEAMAAAAAAAAAAATRSLTTLRTSHGFAEVMARLLSPNVGVAEARSASVAFSIAITCTSEYYAACTSALKTAAAVFRAAVEAEAAFSHSALASAAFCTATAECDVAQRDATVAGTAALHAMDLAEAAVSMSRKTADALTLTTPIAAVDQ